MRSKPKSIDASKLKNITVIGVACASFGGISAAALYFLVAPLLGADTSMAIALFFLIIFAVSCAAFFIGLAFLWMAALLYSAKYSRKK